MFKTALKDTYLGGTTPIALKNEVASCGKMYYEKDNQVMINQSVNERYTRFLFKIKALLQEVGFPLYISAKSFNNLSPDVREFLISEGVQVNYRLPTETNLQGNQRLILVRNSAAEEKNKTKTVKLSVLPAGGGLHHRTFMRIPRESP